jgi:hypothetical protein
MKSAMILMKIDLVYGLRGLLKVARRAIRGGDRRVPVLKSRVSVSRIKRMIRKRGLALDESGSPTWFYTAYHREDSDPLTNYTLEFICREVSKNSDVLVTGCGTGIMLFFLIDQGFTNVEGFDFLDKCVLVANDVAMLGGYTTRIWRDDGFNPTLRKKYNLITALHWVFSAWMGNYGNKSVSVEDARAPGTRERLLSDFLSRYSPHLHSGGLLIVELTDAVADYRVPLDGGVRAVPLSDIYPVRHTPGQVTTCAEQCGLKVVSYRMCCSYGHQPRTSYILKKS